jgi:two-component system, cell cycle response regulator
MHAVVVDPSRVVLKLITQMLAERGDRATEFIDSDAALRCIKEDPSVDLLISSLEVQPLTGLELCWEARMAMPARRSLYSMVMSSLSDENRLAEALDCGADDMIAKPINPLEFHARTRLAGRLKAAQLHLVRLAETDSLTGLLNRRAFFEQLNAKLVRAQLTSAPSALLVDIDHFKRVNDFHGHLVGDTVICKVADEVGKLSDVSGRLGGEEFALILDPMPENRLMKLADNLRRDCSERVFQGDGRQFSITCSIGVSRWRPGDQADDLLKRADVALYKAKADGRNRVAVINEPLVMAEASRTVVRRNQRMKDEH